MTSPVPPSSSPAAEPATTPVRDAGDALSLARSVAGEEDPGASLDAPTHVPPPAPGRAAQAPGDEAPPGTPGTGETPCRACGGTGRRGDGAPCPECAGQGRVTVGIGGG